LVYGQPVLPEYHPSHAMKRDKASFFALLAAAVILGSVGIKSYFDYRLAVETKSAPPAPTQDAKPDPASPQPDAKAEAEEKIAVAGSINQLPRSVLPPIPDAILNPTPPSTPPASTAKSGVAPVKAEAPAAGPSSAEVEALRQETALFQQKLDQLRSGGGPTSAVRTADSSLPPLPPTPPLAPMPATPNSALQAALNPETAILAPEPGTGGAIPPPGIPGPEDATATPPSPAETEAEIAAMAEQIKRQSAIAKVTHYNAEGAFLILDGGTDRNLKPEMRLAVRRGSEILGFIKIVQVEANESVAELMSKNKHSPTARKPGPGDDVIAFNLF
jgi:hypothetical protein